MSNQQARALVLIAGNGAVIATVLSMAMPHFLEGRAHSHHILHLVLGFGLLLSLAGVGASYRSLMQSENPARFGRWEALGMSGVVGPVGAVALGWGLAAARPTPPVQCPPTTAVESVAQPAAPASAP